MMGFCCDPLPKQKHSTGGALRAVVFFFAFEATLWTFSTWKCKFVIWRMAPCSLHSAPCCCVRVLSNFSLLLSALLAEHTCPWCHVAHLKPSNARDKLKGLILHAAVELQVWLLMVILTNPRSRSIATSSKQNIPLDLFTCTQSPWNAKRKHNESRPSIIMVKTLRQTGATCLSINKRQHVPDPRLGTSVRACNQLARK